jgi:hypothetical protein
MDLAARGCKALGYRLSGPTPVDHMCVKHLRDSFRVVVAFEGRHRAWILLIGRHDDQDPVLNVYAELYRLLGAKPPDGDYSCAGASRPRLRAGGGPGWGRCPDWRAACPPGRCRPGLGLTRPVQIQPGGPGSRAGQPDPARRLESQARDSASARGLGAAG